MIKTVTFNAAGGPITAKAIFLGNMVVGYDLNLREKDSNNQVTLLSADNVTTPVNNSKDLPVPVAGNDGKRVILNGGLSATDPVNFPKYKTRLELYQDGILIGCADETGNLGNTAQKSMVGIELQKNQPLAL